MLHLTDYVEVYVSSLKWYQGGEIGMNDALFPQVISTLIPGSLSSPRQQGRQGSESLGMRLSLHVLPALFH